MTNRVQRLLVALGLVALLVPATAIARPDHAGKGKGQNTAASKSKGKSAKGKSKGKKKGHANKGMKTYVFRGTVASLSGNVVAVDVTKGNSRGKKYADQDPTTTQSFDLTSARIVGHDADGNGKRELADLTEGQPVVIQVKTRTAPTGTDPWTARKLVIQEREETQG